MSDPQNPLRMTSGQFVSQSYDHQAASNDPDRYQKAILDMLRALYQQEDEHMQEFRERRPRHEDLDAKCKCGHLKRKHGVKSSICRFWNGEGDEPACGCRMFEAEVRPVQMPTDPPSRCNWRDHKGARCRQTYPHFNMDHHTTNGIFSNGLNDPVEGVKRLSSDESPGSGADSHPAPDDAAQADIPRTNCVCGHPQSSHYRRSTVCTTPEGTCTCQMFRSPV